MLFQLFWAFFKVGILSLGGGYVFYPLMEQEIVENYGWLTAEEFIEVTGIIQVSPGAISVKYAAYVGYEVAGILGAIVSLLGIILPPALIVIAIAIPYAKYSDGTISSSLLKGIQFATLGLVLYFAWDIASSLSLGFRGIFITLGIFASLVLFNIPAGFMVIIGGVLGIILF